MPIGGERVGTAYVKLIADGSSVPDDVRDAMEKLEPTLRQAGEDHAKAYDKGFDDQYEKDDQKFRDKLDKRLSKALGKMAATGKIIGEEVGDNLFEGIESSLAEAFDPRLAQRIRQNLQAGFAVDQDLNRLQSRMSNINAEAARATREFAQEEAHLQREIRGTIATTDRLVESAQRELKAWERTNQARLNGINDTLREQSKMEKVFDKFDRQLRGVFKRSEEGWRRSGDEIDHAGNRLVGFNSRLDQLSTTIGRITGKGARNDFLNLFGALTEGLTRVGFQVLKLPGYFQAAFGKNGQGLNIGQTLASAAVSAGSFAIAIGVVAAVIAPLAALVSGLTAAVIALASSFVFAAAAAGGVALVLGGVLVASIGAAVAAFKSLSDAQKNSLKDSFQPLIDGAKEFGDAVAKNMLPGLERAGDLLAPLAEDADRLGASVGRAFGDVARNFARTVASPGFTTFRDAFERFLPQAIRDLGAIATNTLAGIGGIFTAAIPMTREFLNWLRGVTREFAEWANSTAGREQLVAFFERAADSARAVGGFIASATTALAELFNQGRGSGDTIFDDMSDALQRFTDYLSENPDALEEWFGNGVDVARDVGNLLLDIADAIDKLDTPESRKALHDIADAIGEIVEAIGKLGPAFTFMAEVGGVIRRIYGGLARFIVNGWQKVAGVVHGAAEAFGAVVSAGRRMAASIGRFLGAVRDRMNAFGDQIGPKMSNVVDRVAGFFRSLPGKIGGALASLVGTVMAHVTPIIGRIQNTVDRVLGFFRSLPGRIGGALNSLAGIVAGAFNSAKDRVAAIPGQIVAMFSGLAGRILSAIGTINIGSLIKFPDPGGGVPFVPGVATGGTFGHITGGPQLRWVGEDGPEAIVPLNRPLSQVDPSVRGLSAIAQGYGSAPDRTKIDASGWTIVTPTEDPAAVAQEAINKMVAAAM